MNSLVKATTMVSICFASLILGGCASSRLMDTWQDPSFREGPLHKVLVIAVRKDAANRRIWEDAFTGALKKYAVEAAPSYSLFPDSLPDTNAVIQSVPINRFDGILFIRRHPTETAAQYIPGYTTTEQGAPCSYWDKYCESYREIEHPGYVDSQKVDVNSIDITTTGKNSRLIWSTTSKTPGPVSETDVQRGVVGLVIAELAKENIIKAKK